MAATATTALQKMATRGQQKPRRQHHSSREQPQPQLMGRMCSRSSRSRSPLHAAAGSATAVRKGSRCTDLRAEGCKQHARIGNLGCEFHIQSYFIMANWA